MLRIVGTVEAVGGSTASRLGPTSGGVGNVGGGGLSSGGGGARSRLASVIAFNTRARGFAVSVLLLVVPFVDDHTAIAADACKG